MLMCFDSSVNPERDWFFSQKTESILVSLRLVAIDRSTGINRNCLDGYNLFMHRRAALLEALGGEAGCKRLSAEFYGRVAKDPVLRPLFPGKSLRCATEEFAAFLIQFLGGDEEQTQFRWWLSLRESHARFKIAPAQRSAWLKNMGATLKAARLDEVTRKAFGEFFQHSSAYVVGKEATEPAHEELAARWTEQRVLDDAVGAIAGGHDHEALALAAQFVSRPSVFVGLLARMVQSGSGELVRFAVDAVKSEPSLAARRFSGRTLLHFASGAGCFEVAALLLQLGTDPNIQDRGGHTPLYCVANQCGSEIGPEIVRTLVRAGGDVNACGGVTRATPLHMAARRGYVGIAGALLDCGAAIDAKDSKGDTPLRRAMNCRKDGVARLLVDRGAR
jgi:hemoglobin